MHPKIKEYIEKEGKVPIITKVQEMLGCSADEAIREWSKAVKPTVSVNFRMLTMFYLIAFFFLTFMSVYYSEVWFEKYLSRWQSIAMAISLVGGGIAIFQSIPKSKIFRKLVLIVLWVMLTGFSMISTIAGQYEMQDKQNINSEYATYQSRVKTRDSLDAYVFSIQGEITALSESLGGLTIGFKQYNDVNYLLTTKRRDLKAQQDKLEKINSEIESLGVVTDDTDFFAFITKVSGMPYNVVSFLMKLFPAIFIDLLAPIFLHLYLTLKPEDFVD